MKFSTASKLISGVLAGLAGCSSPDEGGGTTPIFPSGGSAGSAAVTAGSSHATAGTGGGSNGGVAGSTGGNTTAGSSPVAGGGMSTGGAMGGSGGGDPSQDITKAWKSDGCGKAYPGQSGQAADIPTMGTKDAQCAAALDGQPKCGPWGQATSTWQQEPLKREYTVFLPQGYDPNKAYPLVFLGPGCGGASKDVYGLNGNANNSIIRVGLRPPPASIGHGTNPGEGCFDDKEGDDSVDWVFYENLYDKLNAELCFDRNRVFSNGNSSGSWFSNELGCKYAGDPKRPVRGVLPNTGGLPTDAKHVPQCSTGKMAGMWIHEVGDTTNPFAGNKVAIARAMAVNGCTGAKDWDAALNMNQVENYPIGGGLPDDRCKKIKGCPDLYPLVVCALPGNGHGSHDQEANNGFSTFVKMFSSGPFLTQ